MKNLLPLFFILCAVSCGNHRPAVVLDCAEQLMSERPDSAKNILETIDRKTLKSRELKARHALLYSQALDKNYIDVADDSLTKVALAYYKRRGEDIDRAKAYYYAAIVAGNGGDVEEAITQIVNARIYIDRCDDIAMRGLVYCRLADLYFSQYDLTTAEAAYSEAVKAFEADDNKYNMMYALYQRGQVLTLLDRFEEALADLAIVKDMAMEHQYNELVINAAALMGKIHADNDSDIEALWEYKQDFFALCDRYNGGEIPIDHYATLGRIYFNENKLDSAKLCYTYYCQGQSNVHYFSVGILAMLSKIECINHNYQNALIYKDKYARYSDSLNVRIQTMLVKNAERKYQNEYLEKENHALREKGRLERTIFVLTSVVVLLVGSVLLKRFLKKKREEITTYQHYIEDGENLYSELLSKYNTLKDNIHVRDELFSLLENRIQSLKQLLEWASVYETNTDNFYKHFREHLKIASGKNIELAEDVIAIANISCNGIVEYLHVNYPQLTQYELCYCGFVCLGFSPEAVRILYNHTNMNSIYTMRSKIRAKLGLTNHTHNLETYILEVMQQRVENTPPPKCRALIFRSIDVNSIAVRVKLLIYSMLRCWDIEYRLGIRF